MPIWLRKFTFNKIKDFYDQKNEAQEQSNNQANGIQNLLSKGPDISPSYRSKASPK